MTKKLIQKLIDQGKGLLWIKDVKESRLSLFKILGTEYYVYFDSRDTTAWAGVDSEHEYGQVIL